ncbi:MAG: hypothetical protein R3C58_10230 [Parvularculaceae bacterium]
MSVDIAGYLAQLSLTGWLIIGFIGANALIAGVCVIERGLVKAPAARVED